MNITLPYNKEQVTIILEGRIRFSDVIDLKSIIDRYKKLCKQIIISSYMNDDYESQLREICPNIIILRHSEEEIIKKTNERYGLNPDRFGNIRLQKRGFQQFFHMESTLQLVKTPYVIKTRVDQEFSNFRYFIHETILNGPSQKVTLFPYYIRGASLKKYHPSDMLIGSTTKIIKEIFLSDEFSLKRKDMMLIEPAIYKGYIDKKAKEINTKNVDDMNNEEYGRFMSKLFKVVNSKKLEPYCIHGHWNHFDDAKYKKYDESCNDNTYEFFFHGCEPGVEPGFDKNKK